MSRNGYKKKTIYIFAGALSCTGCLMMMAFPAVALNAAQKGIVLWASSVLPALLPFFICANFMTALGLPAYIGRIFEKPFQKLFGAPGISAFIFSVSITSGYPMGAKLIGDFGRSGEITRSDARRMLTFCSTSGPLFMLGAVGAGMLASSAAGAVIALSHYLGALLNGLLFRLIPADDPGPPRTTPVRGASRKGSLLELFTDSMISSFRALAIICGYIVLFMMITDFIRLSGVLDFMRNDWAISSLSGLLEMTVGCSGVAESVSPDLAGKCILCAFLVSFGGISVYAQSMSMLSGLNIGSLYYLAAKISHGLLAAVIAGLIGPLLLRLDSVAVWAFQKEDIVTGLGFFYQLLFSTKMVIMVVFLFLITVLADRLIGKTRERSGKRE